VPPEPPALEHSAWINNFVKHGLQQNELKQDFVKQILYHDDAQLEASERTPIKSLLQSPTPVWLTLNAHTDQVHSVRAGPYAIKNRALWQVSKVYDDTQGAFMVAVEPLQAKYECIREN